MSSATDQQNAPAGERTIAGYVLQERLGEGGYGTVWRAIGPGGLPKAVKVMRGRFDSQSADTELRALRRMRELRHPFVLSVERIEVIDEQLIIVTELAEGSLQDRFDKLKSSGTRGIPFEELIGYLRDAADALDFMCQQHGLQHLDIKPGNLLLQGGHLKVADFGLLKDVRQTQQSLVSGFTPLYAPPELFEGSPGSCSDQYSLAIVYQTMLTGTPPYNGRTAAQLASQHLSSSPDLSPLPASDRPAVGRALSKNPSARFRNCREFIEALTGGRSRSDAPTRPAAKPGSAGPTDAGRLVSIDAVQARPSVPAPPLPALAPPRHRPQIVVGIGGLATCALLAYRARCAARFGRPDGLPTFPVLAVDTDSRALAEARRPGGAARLGDLETLATPLRDLHEYRAQAPSTLDWLGRRWLYNIPRSRQVEGMRPLGRLALLDHAEAFCRRLGALIHEACAESALEAAAQATGVAFGNSPEIVLVAAAQGGTGSGAVFDAAYLARAVLAQLNLTGTITGVLLHGVSARDKSRAVPTACATACLREWAHYSAAGYQATLAAGRIESERPPFDHTYFLHLGEGLTDEELENSAGRVAEYLFRSAATPVRSFLDAARRPVATTVDRSSGANTTLRTFGLVAAGSCQGTASAAESSLCRHVVRIWKEASPAASDSAATPEAWAAKTLGELRLELDPVLGMATTVMRSDVGRSFQTFVTERVSQMPARGVDMAAWQRQVQADFRAPQKDTPLNQPGAMLYSVAVQIKTWAQQCGEALGARLLASAADDGAGADVVMERLARTQAGLKALLARLDSVAASGTFTAEPATRTQVVESPNDPRAVVRAAYQHWFGAGLIACLIEGVKEAARATESLGDELTHLRQRLEALDAALGDADEATVPDARRTADESSSKSLAPRFAQWLHNAGELTIRSLLAADDEAFAGWPGRLVEAARVFLAENGVDGFGELASDAPRGLELGPRLNDVGGTHRVLLVSRGEESPATRQKLEQRFGNGATSLRDPGEAPCILCEGEGLDVAAVISRLAAGDARALECAEQLLTRRDVVWTLPQRG